MMIEAETRLACRPELLPLNRLIVKNNGANRYTPFRGQLESRLLGSEWG
jgi:hypothetical protein